MTIEERIKEKLIEIEEKENVRILFAVESGSRAWDFASPDSDYDVRFVYIRQKEDYLRIDKERDVIEWQLDDVFDINGWDLQKALGLLHSSNPTLFEWLNSPIVYRSSKEHIELKEIAKTYFNQKRCALHYINMAKHNFMAYLQKDLVRPKKYLYVIRSLLATKWVIEKNTNPPVLFSELVDVYPDDYLLPIINDILDKKKTTPELNEEPQNKELNLYLKNEMEELKSISENLEDKNTNWNELNTFFLNALNHDRFSNRVKDLKENTHVQIFNVVKEMVLEGHSLSDKAVFDSNIVSKLLEAYYHQYCLCKYDDDTDKLLEVKETEVSLPLDKRTSGILEELNWLLDNGYNINSHVHFGKYNEAIDDFTDYPVTHVFALPNDKYMADWLLEQGCEKQLNKDIGDDEILADWCFDNLDICSEDFPRSGSEAKALCEITADLVRKLIKAGCKRKKGLWMSVDKDNKVSFHYPN